MNAMENFEKDKKACRKDSLFEIMKQSANNVKELRLELDTIQAAFVKISAKNLKLSGKLFVKSVINGSRV